jgi:hypothetical protein
MRRRPYGFRSPRARPLFPGVAPADRKPVRSLPEACGRRAAGRFFRNVDPRDGDAAIRRVLPFGFLELSSKNSGYQLDGTRYRARSHLPRACEGQSDRDPNSTRVKLTKAT